MKPDSTSWYAHAAPGLAKVLKLRPLAADEQHTEAAITTTTATAADKEPFPADRVAARQEVHLADVFTELNKDGNIFNLTSLQQQTPPPVVTPVHGKAAHTLDVRKRKLKLERKRRNELEHLLQRKKDRADQCSQRRRRGEKRIRLLEKAQNVPERVNLWSSLVYMAQLQRAFCSALALRRGRATLQLLFLPALYRLSQRSRTAVRRQDILTSFVSNGSESFLADQAAKHPLFQKFPPHLRKQLFSVCKVRQYIAGETICYQSEPLTSMYLILGGTCSILCRLKASDPGAKRTELLRLKHNDSFGEHGVLLEQKHISSLVAAADSVVLEVTFTQFTQIASLLTPEDTKELTSFVTTKYKNLMSANFPLSLQDLRTHSNVFSSFPDEQVGGEAFLLQWRFGVFAPGEEMFVEGDVAVGCFFVARGEVCLSSTGDMPDRVLSEGMMFGQNDIVFVQRCSATATALTASNLWFLPKEPLNSLLAHDPAALLSYCERVNSEEEASLRISPESCDKVLGSFPSVAHLPQRFVKGFLNFLKPKFFSMGEIIGTRGQPVQHAMYVAKGTFEMSDPQRRLCCAPYVLGSSEAMAKGRWGATLKAATRVQTWVINAGSLRHILSSAAHSSERAPTTLSLISVGSAVSRAKGVLTKLRRGTAEKSTSRKVSPSTSPRKSGSTPSKQKTDILPSLTPGEGSSQRNLLNRSLLAPPPVGVGANGDDVESDKLYAEEARRSMLEGALSKVTHLKQVGGANWSGKSKEASVYNLTESDETVLLETFTQKMKDLEDGRREEEEEGGAAAGGLDVHAVSALIKMHSPVRKYRRPREAKTVLICTPRPTKLPPLMNPGVGGGGGGGEEPSAN